MDKSIKYLVAAGISFFITILQVAAPWQIDRLLGFERGHLLIIAASASALVALVVLLSRQWVNTAKRLEALYQEKVALFKQVSHEFRTPLTSIVAYAAILRESPPSDLQTKDRYLDIIAREADRLTELVESMLTIARLDPQSERPQRQEIDLGAELAAVVAELEASAQRARVTIVPVVERPLPTIYGEPASMHRMLANLLDNAIKYNRPGGRVQVVLRPHAKGVQLSVADTGSGIAPASLPHVFDEFYRGPEANAAKTPGSGLGLAIVKHIVGVHGGDVSVESRLGEGSLFVVRLPRGLRKGDSHRRAIIQRSPVDENIKDAV